MKDPGYYISAVSRLTGDREKISPIMSHEKAVSLLERKKKSWSHGRYKAWERLRIERNHPSELILKFE